MKKAIYLMIIFSLLTFGISSISFAETKTDAQPTITSVRLGFNSIYKAGFWTPIFVTLTAGSKASQGKLVVLTHDADGDLFEVQRPYKIEAGTKKTFQLTIKPGLMTTRLTVLLKNEQQQELSRRNYRSNSLIATEKIPTPKSPQTELILRIGPAVAVRGVIQQVQTNTMLAGTMEINQLPSDPMAYASVNTILISLSDRKFNEQFMAAHDQLQAILKWVESGGYLILSVGKNAPQVFTKSPELAKLAPGKFDQLMPLPESSPIELYTSSRIRLSDRGRIDIQIARLKETRGSIESFYGTNPQQLPLIIRSAYHFGQVLYVGFDLNSETLRQWGKGTNRERTTSSATRLTDGLQGRSKLLARLLGRNIDATDVSKSPQLERNLRDVTDHFSDTTVFPFWLIAMMIVFYLLVIGPIDYFVVKKVFQKTFLTWITFPLTILVTSLIAYLIASGFKGDQAQLNQIDLIDIEISESDSNNTAAVHLRGTTWFNLFSSEMQTYDFSIQPPKNFFDTQNQKLQSNSQTWLSVFGVPNLRVKENNVVADKPYTISQSSSEQNPSELKNVAISKWSSKSIMAQWKTKGNLSGATSITLGPNQRLHGNIVNITNIQLTDCILLYQSDVYNIGLLEAGESRAIKDLAISRFKRFIGADWGIEEEVPLAKQTESVEAQQRSIKSLLKLMLFETTTRSKQAYFDEPNYLNQLDMSPMLKVNKAILVGFSKQPITKLRIHGHLKNKPLTAQPSATVSVVRLTIPVKKIDIHD